MLLWGWLKPSFRFFHSVLWENSNELSGQPSIWGSIGNDVVASKLSSLSLTWLYKIQKWKRRSSVIATVGFPLDPKVQIKGNKCSFMLAFLGAWRYQWNEMSACVCVHVCTRVLALTCTCEGRCICVCRLVRSDQREETGNLQSVWINSRLVFFS